MWFSGHSNSTFFVLVESYREKLTYFVLEFLSVVLKLFWHSAFHSGCLHSLFNGLNTQLG